ncbi:MAG: glucokinase, partial [Methylobacteriaceae bacterium]|nr:glucokinase [Methylobacteriaceae bacterium]
MPDNAVDAVQSFRFPVLVGDIGGTNARFALVVEPGSAPVSARRIRVADYQNPVEALDAVIPEFPVRPASAFFAIAGPVEGPCVPLTNAPWILDAAEIGT